MREEEERQAAIEVDRPAEVRRFESRWIAPPGSLAG